MSVTRFSESIGYEPDLNGCRKKIVEYCQHSEGAIDRLQQENAELRKALRGMVESYNLYNSNVSNICKLNSMASQAEELLNKND